jgi:hypothetical protein
MVSEHFFSHFIEGLTHCTYIKEIADTLNILVDNFVQRRGIAPRGTTPNRRPLALSINPSWNSLNWHTLQLGSSDKSKGIRAVRT